MTDIKSTTERATHTPGPWEVKQGSDDWDFIVAEPGGNTICEPNTCAIDFADLDPTVRTISLAEAKANARLMAASPKLLDSVKELHVILRDGMQGDYDDMVAALRRARIAIEEADGAQ